MKDGSTQSARFHTGEVDLAYLAGPAGDLPVLLLHGTGSRWQPFKELIPALSERFHVYALDLRGHGMSGHTPGCYRLGDYSRDVQRFTAQVVQRPVVIYGHSLGALVGIHLAAHHPQQVKALILGDPPLYYHDTQTKNTFWQAAFKELLDFQLAHPDPVEMERWLAEHFPGMSPERREERVASLAGLDPDVVQAIIQDTLMADLSLSNLVERVACPVLLLRGNPKLGSALREQDVVFARQAFSQIEILEMESVGHALLPVSLLPEMMAFIERVQGASMQR